MKWIRWPSIVVVNWGNAVQRPLLGAPVELVEPVGHELLQGVDRDAAFRARERLRPAGGPQTGAQVREVGFAGCRS